MFSIKIYWKNALPLYTCFTKYSNESLLLTSELLQVVHMINRKHLSKGDIHVMTDIFGNTDGMSCQKSVTNLWSNNHTSQIRKHYNACKAKFIHLSVF